MRAGVLFSAAALGAALTAAPAQAALIGFYDFENSDATDGSGAGNDGTVGSLVGFDVGGGLGGGTAASFTPLAGNAFDNMISLPIDVNYSVLPQVTFGGWFQLGEGFSGRLSVLSHDNGSFDRTLGLDQRGCGFTCWGAFTGLTVTGIGAKTPTVGDWVFAAVSYDGTDVNLWVDGVGGTATDYTESDTGFMQLFLGGNPGFDEDFTGLADDVFVFDEALTLAQLAAIETNGVQAQVPLPAAAPLLLVGLGGLGLLARRRKG